MDYHFKVEVDLTKPQLDVLEAVFVMVNREYAKSKGKRKALAIAQVHSTGWMAATALPWPYARLVEWIFALYLKVQGRKALPLLPIRQAPERVTIHTDN